MNGLTEALRAQARVDAGGEVSTAHGWISLSGRPIAEVDADGIYWSERAMEWRICRQEEGRWWARPVCMYVRESAEEAAARVSVARAAMFRPDPEIRAQLRAEQESLERKNDPYRGVGEDR